jgi:glycosyltransferase involved in cell wall biosynthesis
MQMLYPSADLIVTPLADLGEELRGALNKPNLPIREILNPLFDESQVGACIPNERPNGTGSANGHPCFVAAGRFSKVKAYDLLIRAFQYVVKRHPDVRLRLLGDGEERDFLRTLARSLGVAERIHFEGFVTRPTDFFRSATALVVSSHREGTPNVIPEAMSVGLPVIARDCSVGVRRLLGEGRAGVLISGAQPDDLAKGMLGLMNNPSERARLVKAGYEQARKFTFQRTLPRFEQALRDVQDRGVERGAPIVSEL